MTDKCFVDTNILVYAHDALSGDKHQRSRNLLEKLWDSGQGVLSTQVIQELCVSLQRKISKPLAVAEIRPIVQDYMAWDIVLITANSVMRALDVQARFRISFWDALIIQAAEESGASVLYSEDLSHGQNYGFIRVVNPLLATSELGEP
jgi:predicted nucleic acid-binding protein